MRLVGRISRVFVAAAFVAASTTIGPARVDAACIQGGQSAASPPTVTFLRSYRSSFAAPARLALDTAGNLYTADPIKGEVVVRAADGRVTARRSGLGYVISLAVDAQGRIYAGEGIEGKVTVFDGNWRELFRLGKGAGEFLLPNDISLDGPSGRVYVTDSKAHEVKVYEATGAKLFGFGSMGSGDGMFDFPAGIYVDGPTSAVFVTDQLNSRVQVFDLNGDFQYCFGRRGTTPGRFNLPQGIWVGTGGRVYVTDAFDGRVQVLERDGDSLGFIGAFGSKPGETRIPVDLVVDASNRMFVAAGNNARLEVFGIDGFSDPETVVPANVTIAPDPLVRGCVESVVVANVEVPGYPLDAIDLPSVSANGVGLRAAAAVVEDSDRDGIPELRVEFDRAALLATMPGSGPTQGSLSVSGSLGGKSFEAESEVSVVEAPDDDGDGVCEEADACEGTLPGEPTDAAGCSLDQLCPCVGPSAGESWLRHSKYVTCMRRVSRDFMKRQLLSAADRKNKIVTAKQSGCGGLCPETVLTDLADALGCVDRLCPCKGPAPGRAWAKKSRYTKCVWRRVRLARRLGLITWNQQRVAVTEARQSRCGMP